MITLGIFSQRIVPTFYLGHFYLLTCTPLRPLFFARITTINPFALFQARLKNEAKTPHFYTFSTSNISQRLTSIPSVDLNLKTS